jgi:hypothetical protein
MLHVGSDTTIGVPFTAADARALDAALAELLKTFAEKQKAARPKRWDLMEQRFGGGGGGGEGGGVDLFEVCGFARAHARRLWLAGEERRPRNIHTNKALQYNTDALKTHKH